MNNKTLVLVLVVLSLCTDRVSAGRDSDNRPLAMRERIDSVTRDDRLLNDGAPPATRTGAADPALVGRWDGPYVWPVLAIHAFMLPTGKVLHYAFPGEIQFPSAYVWDPVTWEFTPVPVNRPLFCSGHSFLPDGRLLVTGGNGPAPPDEFRGIRDTHIFDPFTETWTRVQDMADGRWYPTNVTLADGRVLVFSGLNEQTGAVNGNVEVYDPDSFTGWQVVAQVELPLYPRMYFLSSGDLFYSGPSLWTGKLAVGTWSWYDEVPMNYGGRWDGLSVPLPGQADRVMVAGGQNGQVVTATAEIIDLGAPSPAWRFTQPMSFPRMHANGVILPDGKVLVIGGHSEMHNDVGDVPPPSAVYEAELFDPVTETWTVMAAMQTARVYHSTAILLPDARVLAAGSTDIGPTGQTAEIYNPPYLFRSPRPVIVSAPPSVSYGASFEIQTPDAAAIKAVVLIRLSSVTHSVNMDQRYVGLEYTQLPASPGGLLAQAPPDSETAPPGYYMLFVLNADDVPSTAKMIQLSPVPEPIPAVSQWGLAVMSLLILSAGTLVLRRRRLPA